MREILWEETGAVNYCLERETQLSVCHHQLLRQKTNRALRGFLRRVLVEEMLVPGAAFNLLSGLNFTLGGLRCAAAIFPDPLQKSFEARNG